MKQWKLILKILLVLVLVGSSLYIGIRQMEYQKGSQAYSDAEEIAAVPLPEVPIPPVESVEPEEASNRDPYLDMYASIDLDALREINEEVIGWISIPYTEVSYPLLQAEDNDYYLKRTWKKESNSMGSIYLECQNAADLSDFNTLIYGHNMRNGSMFGSLKQYRDLEYWKEHPSIYIADDNGVHRYDIFAAHQAGVRTITFGLGLTEPEHQQEFIDFTLSNSSIDTGIIPTIEDRIITLTTCTSSGYSSRWVVQGVLYTEDLMESEP